MSSKVNFSKGWRDEIRYKFWQIIKCIKVSIVSEFPKGTAVLNVPYLENVKILIEVRVGFGTLRIGLC